MPYENFVINILPKLSGVDVLVLAFGIVDEVIYEKEHQTQHGVLRELSLLSRNLECVVLAGIVTHLGNKKYRSIVVLDEGKILGIVDQIFVLSPFSAGKEISIFEHEKLGRFGVAVDDDVASSEVQKLFEKYAVDVVFNLHDKTTSKSETAYRVMSYNRF